MPLVFDVLEAGIAQQSLEHGSNADMPPIHRKATSCFVKCPCSDVPQLIERLGGRHRHFQFGETDDSARAQDALAFGKQLRPFAGPHDAKERPYIDQVEGRLLKEQWLLYIHDHEPGISIATRDGLCLCEAYHG